MSRPPRSSLDALRSLTAVLALVSAALVVATASPSQATRPSAAPFAHPADVLSSPDDAPQGSTYELAAAHAVRSRLVTVRQSLFPVDVSRRPQVRFNLFAGATYTGVIARTETGLGSRSWVGSLKDHQGYFYAARSGGVMLLHVATYRHGIYEVSQVRGSTYRVVRLAADAPEDAKDVLPTPRRVAPRHATATADSRSQIDVMVTYSNQALAAEGSTSAMKARIALAVTETNTGYAKSGITTRIRLVHTMPAGYDESGDFTRDLRRLVGTGDVYMRGVHAERNRFGADMVALILENRGFCGLADAVLATPSTAFTTISDSCTTGYYAFAHEFGHLQGARHDKYVDPTNTPYSYGHGYVNVAHRWRTVMAYNNKCRARHLVCTRLNRWSNPHKTYGGIALGNSSTQNWKVLNATAGTVANFRSATIAGRFSSSMNTAEGSTGWSPVVGAWTKGATWYSSEGVAGTRASATHSGTYGDVTVEARVRRTTSTEDANALLIGAPGHLTGSAKWTPSYMFQYTNDKTFSVYKVAANGSTVVLAPWTATTTIVPRGWNRLKFSKVGGSLRFWINGTRVWSGSDPLVEVGQVGVSLVQPATPSGRLDVDWVKTGNTPTANRTGRSGSGSPGAPR
jgi:hypothetical protein